jgi:citrate synthase
VFLGPVGDTAGFLDAILERMPEESRSDDDALEQAATDAVQKAVADARRIPGLGHPIHRDGDPRTARLYELADQNGLLGPHLRLLNFVAAAHHAGTGKSLPINGAGVAGAALADLGFPQPVAHGLALLARAAGLVGHLAEEATHPIGMRLWEEVNSRAVAVDEAESDD